MTSLQIDEPKRSPVIVTSSWDDGHPSDLRVAELLGKHGLPGTFYVPISSRRSGSVNVPRLRALQSLGMEIGSHTMTHEALGKLTRQVARQELSDSKDALEQALGEAIHSFCYPKGTHNDPICTLVREAGYRLGRTTVGFRTDLDFDPFRMPVSFQFHPKSRAEIMRHVLREKNLPGMANWFKLAKCDVGIVELTERLLAHVLSNGGFLHIWGHSWEIDENNLWGTLEQVAGTLAGLKDVIYCTNSDVVLKSYSGDGIVFR